jgi:hypothetical protein
MRSNKSIIVTLAGGFLSSALLFACAPEPLIGANNDESDATTSPDTGLADTTPPPNSNNPPGNNPPGNNPPGNDQRFAQIADILRGGCSIAACHGTQGLGGQFYIEGAFTASDAQVRAALENKNARNGNPFIVPGNAAASELYVVLTSEDPTVIMPPVGGPLPSEQLALIESWINDGANY